MAEYGVLVGLIVSVLSALVSAFALVRSAREWKTVSLQNAKLQEEITKLREDARDRTARITKPSAEELREYVTEPLRQELERNQRHTFDRIVSGANHFAAREMEDVKEEVLRILQQSALDTKDADIRLAAAVSQALKEHATYEREIILARLSEVEKNIVTEVKPWWRR